MTIGSAKNGVKSRRLQMSAFILSQSLNGYGNEGQRAAAASPRAFSENGARRFPVFVRMGSDKNAAKRAKGD